MPLYSYACQCGNCTDAYRTVAERDDAPLCCNAKMKRVISAPSMVMDDIQPYKSMITGEMITSRSRHREHLRDHGMIEIGNELKYLQPKPRKPTPGIKEELIWLANEKLRY